jgi:hypothetical protein
VQLQPSRQLRGTKALLKLFMILLLLYTVLYQDVMFQKSYLHNLKCNVNERWFLIVYYSVLGVSLSSPDLDIDANN